jgi:hypothetical protein
MDALAPLPSLSSLEASSDTGGVAYAADLMVERRALDNQTQMMSELLSTGLPRQGAYLDLSPAAQARLS